MLEYVKWRGDLSLNVAPMNEIDLLIFTQLSYLHFCDVLGSQGAPLRAAARLVEAIPREPGNVQIVTDRHTLLAAVAESERFGNLTVSHCEDLFDPARAMQFAAVTFGLPDGSHVVAFRGTDATVVGWKENFNMSFACPVPSQSEAVRYLNDVAAATVGPLRLCGHSKGGNLALYSATGCTTEVRERITHIDLFDAPGLDNATLATEGYRSVLPKVSAYVPQTSIIGQLMGVPEHYTVVHSTVTGMGQHNTFTWALNGPRFDTLPALDNTSKLIKATMDDFLIDSTPEKRQLLVQTLFDVLGAANTHTFGEMADRWTDTAGALWDAVWKLDGATLKAVLSIVGSLASSGADSAKKFIAAYRDQSAGGNLAGVKNNVGYIGSDVTTTASGKEPANENGVTETADKTISEVRTEKASHSDSNGTTKTTLTSGNSASNGTNGTNAVSGLASAGMESLRKLIATFRDDSTQNKS